MYMDEIPQLVPPSVSSADAMDEEEDSTPFSVSLSSTNEIINFAFFFLSTNRFTVNYLGFFSSEGLWQLVLGRPIGARHPSRPLRPRQLIASFSVNCFFFPRRSYVHLQLLHNWVRPISGRARPGRSVSRVVGWGGGGKTEPSLDPSWPNSVSSLESFRSESPFVLLEPRPHNPLSPKTIVLGIK